MSLKAKVEAVIYAAEEPVSLEQLAALLRDEVRAELASASNEASDSLPSAPQPSMEEANDGSYAAESAQIEEMDLRAESASALSEDSGSEDAGDAGTAEPGDDEASGERQGADAESAAGKRRGKKSAARSEEEIAADKAVRARLRELLAELMADYASDGRGMEIRPIAGGYRMATKPEHHDVIRAFAKSLKPPIRLSLAALETLAVIAYKQPVTAPEIAEIRGVESAGVLGTLLDRKLITTAGRKQVIGRPMQYRTSKDFLLRFGLNDVGELPSMEEFSQLASDATIEVSAAEVPTTPSLFTPESEALEPASEADPEPEAPAEPDEPVGN